jgi:hypothetical protein
MIGADRFLPRLYAVVLATVIGLPAWGQDSDTEALRKEIEQLRQKVQKLEEQQAAKPEAGRAAVSPEQTSPAAAGQPAAQSASPTPAPTSVTALRESWSRVARNMSQAEIAEVLGQPNKKTRIDGKLVWYYYYPGIGGASMFFKSNGQVSSYQPPNVGWW